MSHSALAAGVRHLRRAMAAQRHRDESDEQLLHAFIDRRDDSAFAVLVRRHGPMVMSVCRRVLGHQQDAEDAFQATFLVLARNAATLHQKTALAGFLHGTAYRTALAAKRTAARRRKHERQAPVRQADDPSGELLWREVRALLDEEVARLPEIYRSAFVLCCLEGLSQAEAARRLGVKEATVSSRLTAARKQLQLRLSRRGVELTALLAATALTTETASALPAALLTKTIEGAVSPAVAVLANSAPSILGIGKIKLAMLLLAVSLLGGGGVLVYFQRAAAENGMPPAAEKAKSQRPAAPAVKQDKETVAVAGRVLDPDGKPVAGAKLFMPRTKTAEPISSKDFIMKRVGTTDADGRFRLTLDRPSKDGEECFLAHANGFGVDWITLSEGERSGEVTLRLPKDVPITGRVVNTEGRPIAGVSVSAGAIYVPANEDLDAYLAGWLRNWRDNLSTPRKRLHVPLDGVTGAVTTDKEGRFTLRGAGGERIVDVTLTGGVAHSTPHVITRPGFDAKPYNAVLQKEDIKRSLALNPFLGLYPPSLTFVAQPGKTIEGTIKDAASGKPLPGCQVSVYIGWSESIRTVSDAGGKYRLDGVPKRNQGYDISVVPPKDAAYLTRTEHAADTAGFAKVPLDLAMVQGVIVTGRVVDKQTGKGVWGSVGFEPLADNKLIGSKPGFDSQRRGAATDKADGRFRFVAIPGKALLTVQVHEGEKFHGEHLCLYRKTGPDPDHKGIFKYDPDGDFWYVATANGLEILSGTDAVKVIDVKEHGETRVDLFVDRGVTARIAVQDADGKPLAGAWAAGLTDHWPITYKLPEATATVYALNPEKPRTMAFYHTEKKLGGTATVRGDEKEPVVVKLAPVGKVSGRLFDEDGDPLEGVEVSINPPGVIGRELYRFAAPTGKRVLTDKDGRFHLEGVVPDLKFWLNLRRDRTFFVGQPRIGVKQIKPGEALGLGDVRVKPQR